MGIDWWVTQRDAKPVRDAIVGAFLQQWLPVVEAAIKTNKKLRKHPATWEQLASALDRNFASIWRTKKGKVKLSWYDAELIAEIFDLRIEQLTPTRDQWLPAATQILCGDPAVSLSDARAYAFYRMAGGASSNPLDTDALTIVAEQLPDEERCLDQIASAILTTADRVGVMLEQLVDEVPRRTN